MSRGRNQLAYCCSSDKFKGDEMGGSCGTNERRNAYVVLMGRCDGKGVVGNVVRNGS